MRVMRCNHTRVFFFTSAQVAHLALSGALQVRALVHVDVSA